MTAATPFAPSSLPPSGDLPRSVRVEAHLHLAVSAASGSTRIIERREEGAFRFRMPRPLRGAGSAQALEALLVNIAGGLAGGDQCHGVIRAGRGARLVISSATAERIYRSAGDETGITLHLDAAAGADLVWLPQETILHDGARLRRRFEISLAPDARFLAADIVHLGRLASGETFRQGRLRESWRLRIGDRLIFADETRLDAADGLAFTQPGLLGEAHSLATILLAEADAAEALDRIRAVLHRFPEVEAGATAQPGLLLARLMAKDGARLRRASLAVIACLAGARLPLPRLAYAEFPEDRVPEICVPDNKVCP